MQMHIELDVIRAYCYHESQSSMMLEVMSYTGHANRLLCDKNHNKYLG